MRPIVFWMGQNSQTKKCRASQATRQGSYLALQLPTWGLRDRLKYDSASFESNQFILLFFQSIQHTTKASLNQFNSLFKLFSEELDGFNS